jgi:5,5'-dehydrodivanillate O-demethylase oxygenase subunit
MWMVYSAPVEAVGPGTPAGKVLRSYWQPAALSRDLVPGRARPLHILGEELTLYRGESGAPYVVGPRCPHRYTWLHTGRIDGEAIRCFYHGWAFDGGGQCVEQPAEKESFARKVRIPSYPAQEYAGLVFVYLGQGEPPPLPHYPELDDPDVKVAAGIRPPGVWPVNYFQMLENSVDPVHTSFVHLESEPHWNEVPEVSARRTDYGMEVTADRSGDKRHTFFHFPNLMHITVYMIPGSDIEFHHYMWHVPLDDEHSMFISATAIPTRLAGQVPKSLAGRVMDPDAGQDLLTGVRRPQSITEEDFVAMVGQGTFADRTNERLGRSDVAVIKLRRIWSEAVEAVHLREPGTPDPDKAERRPTVGQR